MTGSTPVRRQFTLAGHRVNIADLLQHELIAPGTTIVFDRPRLGETYRASVERDGRIRLPDGEIVHSPTEAVSACIGGPPINGWLAWRVEATDGPTLDELRQKLLDQVATEVTDESDGGDNEDVRRRHEYLRDARRRADEGDPCTVTVRELIAHWGATTRSGFVPQIEADLANHGLTTSPNFQKVTLDAWVMLLAAGSGDNGDSGTAPAAPEDHDESPFGLTVGNLPSALGGVSSVAPNQDIQVAVTTMLLNNYSQLAVLNGPRNLRGAVTWRSIAKARHVDADASLSDAVAPAREVRYDQELVEVLPLLLEDEFVFVRNQSNEVAGILTATDVAQAYGEMASPFFVLGELDQRLRSALARYLTIDAVVKCCDPDGERGIVSFNDLTFGDYQRTFESPDNWASLGWPLDRTAFIQRLDEIRQIRNDVMHFNPDPVPPEAISKLRNFVKLLRDFTE